MIKPCIYDNVCNYKYCVFACSSCKHNNNKDCPYMRTKKEGYLCKRYPTQGWCIWELEEEE